MSRIVILACAVGKTTFIVLESNSIDNSRDALKNFRDTICPAHSSRSGEKAFYGFEIMSEKASPPFAAMPEYRDLLKEDDPLVTNSNNRISRITSLRASARERIMSGSDASAFDIVLLLDFDFIQIAKVDELIAAIVKMKRENLNLICSHGRGPADYYYDSFATVMTDMSFVHPVSLRKDQFLYPGERNLWDSRTFGQPVSDMIVNSKDGFLPVRSCFGGLAFYNAIAYFNEDCSYDSRSHLPDARFLDVNGFPCEHVNFNLCVCPEDKLGKCLISDRMETFWGEYQPGEAIRDLESYVPKYRNQYLV